MKKQLIFILLVTTIWLLGRSSGFCTAGVPWYTDPCYTNIVTTTCSGGSLSLSNVTVSSCGLPISASVDTTTTNLGTNTITSIWIAASTNCPPSTNTSSVTPNVLSNWWAAAGPGSFNANGSGLSASFTPTNVGSGSITFHEAYQNGCDTNIQTTSVSGNYSISCPTITNKPTLATPTQSVSDGWYGATINYNFGCADGWYEWECFSSINNSCNNGDAQTAGIAGQYGNWTDQLYTQDPSGGSCSLTAQQTIYFALVGGGGCTNNNSVCSVQNTISIVITQTNAPATPPHGTIVTSVTIGGGFSTTSTY